jgi:hypothetical protein
MGVPVQLEEQEEESLELEQEVALEAPGAE